MQIQSLPHHTPPVSLICDKFIKLAHTSTLNHKVLAAYMSTERDCRFGTLRRRVSPLKSLPVISTCLMAVVCLVKQDEQHLHSSSSSSSSSSLPFSLLFRNPLATISQLQTDQSTSAIYLHCSTSRTVDVVVFFVLVCLFAFDPLVTPAICMRLSLPLSPNRYSARAPCLSLTFTGIRAEWPLCSQPSRSLLSSPPPPPLNPSR
jgi:hypothetical protein